MMKGRQFLWAWTAASCLVGTSALAAVAQRAAEGPDYYEQRTYHLADEGKRQLVSEYLEHAALPAFHLLVTYRSY